MRWLAIYGCAGGDLLVGAKASGRSRRAASRRRSSGAVDGIGDYWQSEDAFGPFRRWREAAAEPCRCCDYLALCRGGCRVVTAHVSGDPALPDPECPRVIDWRASRGIEAPAPRRSLPVVSTV